MDINDLFNQLSPEIEETAKRTFQRAQGFKDYEDPTKITDLITKITQLEGIHSAMVGRISKLDQNLENAVNLSEQELRSLERELQQTSMETGGGITVGGDTRQERVENLQAGLEESRERLRNKANEQRTHIQDLNQNLSPEMARHLNYRYRAGAPERFEQYIQTRTDEELGGDILRGGGNMDAVLGHAGVRAPSRFGKWSKGVMGQSEEDIYSGIIQEMTAEERVRFREAAEKVAMDVGNKEFQRIEQEYKERSQEQSEVLERWKDSTDDFIEDMRIMRNTGVLSDDEARNLIMDKGRDQALEERGADLSKAWVAQERGDTRQDEGPFGYTPGPDDPQSTGGMGGMAAAAGAAGGYLAGQAGGVPGMKGAGGAAGMAGKMGGAGRMFGPLPAIGLGVASALTDLATPGGRPAAHELAGGVSMAAPGALAAAGSMWGPGGTVAGYLGGQALQPIIEGVLNPYMDFSAQQRHYETLTGENLRGPGADQGGIRSWMEYQIPGMGTDTLQGSQAQARMMNPFMDPAQITELTEALLNLGYSSEEAAERVEPLTSVVADFNLDPNLAAQLSAAGDASGTMSGTGLAYSVGRRIKEVSGQGMTGEQVQQVVSQATEMLGPTVGFENAPGVGLAYSATLQRGNNESDMLFRSQNTAGSLLQSDQALATDPAYLQMAGVDPNLSPDNPEYQAQLVEGRVNIANQMLQRVQGFRDPETGELTAQGLQMLGVESQAYGPLFQGMTPQEIAGLADIAPGEARQDVEKEQSQQEELRKEEQMASRGVGVESTMNTPEGWQRWMPWNNILGSGTNKIQKASRREREKAGKEDSLGAVGVLGQAEGLDPDAIKLESGGTLQDAMKDPETMSALNTGKERVRVGDELMKVEEFNLQSMRNQAYVDEQGKLQTGEVPAGDLGKVQIEFTPPADRFFRKVDIKDESNIAGTVDREQRRGKQNGGRMRLNQGPIHGKP